jgi:hypothetical protein
MFKYRIVRVVAMLFLLFAQSASAFWDAPWVTPGAPNAGDIVSVNLHGGICDSIVQRAGYPQLTQTGNEIVLREYGHHYEEGDELCIYDVGTLVEPIGSFAPGNYTLTVEVAYQDDFGIPQMLTIGVVQFAVAAPALAPVAAPANGSLTLMALAMLLGMVAFKKLRRRLF